MVPLIVWSVAVLLAVGSVWADRRAHRRLAEAKGWPRVEGRVVSVGIASRVNGRCAPEVCYRYEVGGKRYRGDRLRPGGTPIYYAAAQASAAMAGFEPDQPVTVHYRADDPSVAFIDPTLHDPLIYGLRVLAALAGGMALLVTFT